MLMPEMKYLILLFTAGVFFLTKEAASLTITTQKQKLYLEKGEDMVLQCTVSDPGGNFDPFAHLINWYKWQSDAQDRNNEEILYASQKHLEEPFASVRPERHHAPTIDIQETPPKQYKSTIRIDNVEFEDSGWYQCQLKGKDGVMSAVTNEVYVIQRLESLNMYGYEDSQNPPSGPTEEIIGNTLPLNRENGGYFSCIVRGGNPEPTFTIEVDDINRSGFFPLNKSCDLIGGTTYLQIPECTIQRFLDPYKPRDDLVGKRFKCKAEIESDSGVIESREISKVIEIVGKPYVEDESCSPTQLAQPGNAKAIIICKFLSNPVYTSARWVIDADAGIALADGQDRDEYSAEVQVVNQNLYLYEASLRINNVRGGHLKEYVLILENDGYPELRTTIRLEQGGAKDATTGASAACFSLTLTAFLFFLSLILSHT